MSTFFYISTLSTGISRIPTTVAFNYLMITSDFTPDFEKRYATYGIVDGEEIIEPVGRTNVEISLDGFTKSKLESGDVLDTDLLMSLYLAETNVYLYQSYGTAAAATKVTLGATGFSMLTPSCYKIIDFTYTKKVANETLFYWNLLLKEVEGE